MVILLIFPWSDGFAANTDQDQITEESIRLKFCPFEMLKIKKRINAVTVIIPVYDVVKQS